MPARHDGLDAARALAMMLVVSTHAAISFMVTPIGWAVQDQHQHLGVDLYVWIVRAFAMPSFFWLSGYFARAVCEHGGLRGYLVHRVSRIVIPFVVAIVPCSLAVDALWDWGREVTVRAGVAANIPKFLGSSLPIQLGHLWYLYYLLWFSAAAVALVLLARRLRVPTLGGNAILAIPAALTIGVLASLHALHTNTPLSFAPDVPIAIYMGAFFAWGWLVHARPAELDRYARRAWHVLAVAPPLLGVVVATLADPSATEPPPFYAIAASGLFTIAMITTFIGLCVRYAQRPHPALRLASESSYWFYVAHFPLVVFLQVTLANVDLPGPVKYAAIVTITTLVCLATYELLVRRTRLRRLLG